jgi:Sulfotransferase domain
MKVIGAGLPRTATSTQLVVLEQLGFAPCYHMRNVFADLEGTLPAWERLVEGDADWDAILGGFESCCDFPTARFYLELAERYPDAKVLLSVRSGESWAQSMLETIWPIYFGDSMMHHLNQARGIAEEPWRRFLDMMIKILWDPETGAISCGSSGAVADLAAAMERWDEQVKASVPTERLLVWSPADGWEPLCGFLEVPVPAEPIPHINDVAAFNEGIIGGAIAAIDAWWEARERPSGTLHGVAAD